MRDWMVGADDDGCVCVCLGAAEYRARSIRYPGRCEFSVESGV